MKTPVLRTPRLVLRPVTLADAPAIQRHIDNWNVVRRLSTQVPWPYPADGAQRFIEEACLPAMERGEALIWVITRAGSPEEAIGVIDYRPSRDRPDSRGFWLAEAWWGRGLMTEAVTAMQDHVFFELGLERLLVAHSVHNGASRRLKEKTGGRPVGTLRIDHHEGGDEAELWEVTAASWAALRGRSAG